MFGNVRCMIGSEAWLLLVYKECPSRLAYTITFCEKKSPEKLQTFVLNVLLSFTAE
jgi:hypothetical protein